MMCVVNALAVDVVDNAESRPFLMVCVTDVVHSVNEYEKTMKSRLSKISKRDPLNVNVLHNEFTHRKKNPG